MRRADVSRQGLAGVPIVVVEVLPASSVAMDRETKFHLYERAGVPQYWIVDPGGVGPGGVDPDNAGEAPSIEVYDLVEAVDGSSAYVLQVRGDGDAPMTVSGPVSVTLTPATLVD